MESNNRSLGDDMLSDETMPDAEHTTAETQPELPADVQPTESLASETTPDEPTAAEIEEVEAPEGDLEIRDDFEPAADEAADMEEPEGEADTGDALEPVAEVEDIAALDADADAGDDFEPAADEAADMEEPEGDADTGDALEPVAKVEDIAALDADAGDDFEYDAGDDLSDDDADDRDDDDQSGEPADETARIRRGVIIEGTVAATSPTEVQVDLGEGVIGTVASRELERMDRTALEALEIGSPVRVYIVRTQGPDGQPVLSLARAEEEHNWQMAVEHHESQQVYFSKVAGYNKGGLIVRFGKVRGFVPASQVSRERQRRAVGESPEERWGGMVGEDIAVKVVEIDRARNRLILSERAAAREWREKQKSRLLDELAVGEIRKGRVISLADFGAFIDLGGADGLVHLTELSWSHVTHPREILEVGQEVEAQVISVDRERKRIGLSLKRQENDPWQQVVRNYEVHQLVQATVTKLTKFGAFARLVDAPEIEGLIHISELADYRVSHPREVVLVGDVLTLRIVKIDADQRRLGLSLRQVDSAKYMDQDWQAIAEEFEQPEAETVEVAPETLEPEAETVEVMAEAAEPEEDSVEVTPEATGPEDYVPVNENEDDDSPADDDAPESVEDDI